jgi:hypothetical protein
MFILYCREKDIFRYHDDFMSSKTNYHVQIRNVLLVFQIYKQTIVLGKIYYKRQ